MNRDQIITEFIQKLLKMLLEKEKKQQKTVTVNAAQAQNRPGPLGARSAPPFGPTADGRAAKPARRSAPLGPYSARSPPRRPWPSDLNRTAARAPRATKTGDAGSSPEP